MFIHKIAFTVALMLSLFAVGCNSDAKRQGVDGSRVSPTWSYAVYTVSGKFKSISLFEGETRIYAPADSKEANKLLRDYFGDDLVRSEKLPNSRALEITDAFGRRGWELVGIAQDQDDAEYWFKKQSPR